MTQTAAGALLDHPAFRSLSPAGRQLLSQSSTLLRYRLGQSLTDGSILPAQVLLLVQGQARLLGQEQGRMATLVKLGPGNLVGLASLLRGQACESVCAATELVAFALSDDLIVKLHGSEPSFRGWCDSTLFPAEVVALLQAIQQSSASSNGSLLQVLAPAAGQAQLIPPDRPAFRDAVLAGTALFLGSACEGQALCSELADPQVTLPKPIGPFGLRLIALPRDVMDRVIAPSANENKPPATPERSLEGSAIQEAPEAPEVSRLTYGANGERRGMTLVRGEGPLQETMACFQMLAREMKLPYRRDSIEKVLQDALRRGQTLNLQLIGQVAGSLGLHVVGAKVPAGMGTRLQTPSLLSWKEGFALVVASHQGGITLASPRHGWIELTPAEILEAYSEGMDLLVFDRTTSTPDQTFGPSWFLPALSRYRGVLLQVLVASFVVQLFTLANPLLIQIIIDKVINQRSLDTLQVLGFALMVVTLLEGVLGSLRTFLFAETTNRIDQRLGAEVIDHLLRLPLNYFDRRPVGELGSRVAELEKIRGFLTGQALTTVLDAVFSVIYIAVMVLYSWTLTIVALAVLPIQIGITLLGAPLFRRQFRQAAEDNARTQSHLVEVLTGIQTVKAQNVEMVSRWKWQELYGKYISRTFEKTITGTALSQIGQVLQKLSQLLVIWVGAVLVLRGELTLGQLIAFRILSGYVTQPLLRLSTIWQSIQELRVSFERLADVVDTPQESTETDKAKIPLPPIHGDVVFEDVSFSFVQGQPLILKNVDLELKAGTFVGIVGQSGSGKSTLMKLIPRLYSPNSGRILIDHYDIDKVELYSLRRQVGIVPQEPLLFSGTISENIALTQPEADSEDIVRAAKLACAHEFIMELSSGYSTKIGERGAGLSGGQRQRVAIARTLLTRPKLLVMDEATSALDYDTERRVCDNLLEELHDCTVFFITHRLSTIRRADLIVMMHQGAIVETGTHDQLIAQKGRYYTLFRQQEAA
ncbi:MULTISPECIES: ABC transporter transmembrane domain-containing protein [unclassified Synechococcus]|uniref:ABC transporter transmembrane domain-containing protein n=1 Tax=unclassified Synechococcus TaxID=2626047 RepID=UPI0000698390|nr:MULTISPECIES: ABC transporter transmembrane domain-containing protein [unclassified Synechococcus]EAQ75817.1 putative multidrug efflux ABC transporter [Synechococcus sp. WH 5701]WFN59531.1 ABC transporter transmembrane domain-containing protein [Synechococcus sp. CCFWC 502]